MGAVMKVGEVVQLRSGGPKMTVERATKRRVVCVWFRPDGEPRTMPFPASCLRSAEAAAASSPGTPAVRSCACKHRLSRHTAEGQCLEREPDGRPCFGKCGEA